MDINSLVKKAQSGDKIAEDALFQELRDRFCFFLRHRITNEADREEIVQDVLTKIFEKYREIEFEIGIAPWAYKILENKIFDYLRGKKSRGNRFVSDTFDYQTAGKPDKNPILENKLLACIREVSMANKRYARILVLHYQGYKFDEICEKLKINIDNCYTILSRARKMLQRCMKKRADDE